MLLLQIAQALDAELSRLQRLRAIIASLAHAPRALQRLAELPVAPTASIASAPEASESMAPPKRRQQRRQAKPRAAQPGKPVVSGALTAAIPAGPVVVSAVALSEERRAHAIKVKEAASVMAEPSPAHADAVVRDLSHRWLSRESTA